jgi:uncharacterized protein YabN with tetrapyrrole methylase and pyrophosphatase domain
VSGDAGDVCFASPVATMGGMAVSDVLSESRQIQAAAAAVGFDWPDVSGALGKLREEVDELGRAIRDGRPEEQRDELGDVLFSAVNVSRFIGVDALDALGATNRKFSSRFQRVRDEVERSGRDFAEYSLVELDRIWDRVKSAADRGGTESSGANSGQSG